VSSTDSCKETVSLRRTCEFRRIPLISYSDAVYRSRKSTSQAQIHEEVAIPSAAVASAETSIPELPSPPSTAQPFIAAPLPSPPQQPLVIQPPVIDPAVLHPFYTEINHLRSRVESLQSRVNTLESILSAQSSDPSSSMPTPRASPPQGYPFYPYPYPYPAHHWAPQHFVYPPHPPSTSNSYPAEALEPPPPPPPPTDSSTSILPPVPSASTAISDLTLNIAPQFSLPIPPPTRPSTTLSPSIPSTTTKRQRDHEEQQDTDGKDQGPTVRRRGSSSLEKLLSPVSQQGQGLHPPPRKVMERSRREEGETEKEGNALRLGFDDGNERSKE